LFTSYLFQSTSPLPNPFNLFLYFQATQSAFVCGFLAHYFYIWRNCDRRCEGGVRGPWGNGGHLGSRGRRGTRPARRGKGRTVGVGQWRRADIAKMPKSAGDRLATTPSHVYAQSMYHCMCVLVTISTTTNHLVVKNYLHSSSGVREVVSSAIYFLSGTQRKQPMDNKPQMTAYLRWTGQIKRKG
jgi:hypothetical protein